MPHTLREYREHLGYRLGGFLRKTVSLNPDATDTLAQRSILSAELYDADRGSKGYSGQFAWVGKYKDQRRVRDNGYRTLSYVVYSPPSSGSYTITFYGYGTTSSLAYNATYTTVQTAVTALSGLSAATVTNDGTYMIINLPDVIEAEISAGTMVALGGVGAIEVNRGFTRALVIGDEFELNPRLPFDDYDTIQGMNTLINLALHDLWIIDKYPITPIRNSRGTQTYLGLTGLDWLETDEQMIALYYPTYWENIATLTPPGSSTYTISLDMGTDVFTTAAIAYNANAATIQAAIDATEMPEITVAGSSTFTLTLSSVKYAVPTFSVSSGTIVNARTMLEEPARYPTIWKFQYDADANYLGNLFGVEGDSILVEAHRRAKTWKCPQASYGTTGDTWEATTVGLTDDYDMAVPPINDVVDVAYALACDQLAQLNPDNPHWANEAKKHHRKAAATQWFDQPRNDKPRGGFYGSTAGWGSKGYWRTI